MSSICHEYDSINPRLLDNESFHQSQFKLKAPLDMKWKKFSIHGWKEENWNTLWSGLDIPMIITLENPNRILSIQKKWSMTFTNQTPLPHASYVQMFLKDWHLNHLKIYATPSIFILTWKSKPRKGIVLWVNFHLINFQSYLVFGPVYIIIRFKGGHMINTCQTHVCHMLSIWSTVQCYVHSLFYCITHPFSFYLPIMHSTY